MFELTTGRMIAGGVFTVLLGIAAVSDFKSRRIPNNVVLALALGGIAFSVETMPIPQGLGFALGGITLGLVLWLPFYALGWLGAGDVKLMAASGAWLGMIGVLHASVVGAIVGGTLALGMLLWQRSPKHVATDMMLLVNTIRRQPSAIRVRVAATTTGVRLMPYGVALVVGALAVAWMGA